ncbi:MAG: DUF1003 domain-containing protein [Anaerolineaceae bacterium]|nr:DUF1003 domain-containing protein [Anaerolineaceae bacterium]
MSEWHIPEFIKHKRPITQNINQMFDEKLSFGQKTAEWVAKTVGSWRFIIIQSVLLVFWIILNSIALLDHWDPYPFILMNLVLSTQAAYATPIIMMSQNRQAEKDRMESHNDYQVNMKAEMEVRAIMEQLEAQTRMIAELQAMVLHLQGQRDTGE